MHWRDAMPNGIIPTKSPQLLTAAIFIAYCGRMKTREATLFPHEYRQTFHMRRLREHVQQTAACHAVAFLHEDAGVTGEGAGVAGDVHDARGRVFCIQRFAQRLRSGARRVQQPALGLAPGF